MGENRVMEMLFNIQRFANEGFSDSNDLMVGAGTLFFNRLDDEGKYVGWHHLGNVEEFNITTDVTTIEKNSSMNKRRELMASVVTSVAPTASLTLNEYDPENLSMGLYGTVGTEAQTGGTRVTETYTLRTKPGLFHLTIDPDQDDGVFNISGVTIGGDPVPAHIEHGSDSANEGSSLPDVNFDNVKIVVGSTSITAPTSGSADLVINVTSTGTPTDLSDLTIEYSWDGGALTTIPGLTGTTGTYTLTSGVELNFTFDSTSTGSGMETFVVYAATSSFVEGVDYIIDPYLLRGGVIQVPEGSSLVPGNAYTISYVPSNETFTVINGAGAGDITGMLKFVGDPNLGVQYIIEGWKVKITPDGDLSGLISDDFGSYNLSVKFLADYQKHPKYPYYKVTKVGKTNQGDTDDHPYRRIDS